MAGSPTLSVVVPIFGVEPWLDRFLESLAAQSFTDWEGLLILDGATDRSPEIARAWATRDPRFVVHEFPNGGLGAARNKGLALARGEFVAFADSDDLLPVTAYERLIAAFTPSVDFVTGAADDLRSDGTRARYWSTRSAVFDAPATEIRLRDEPQLIGDHTVWNKVFRREFLARNGITFPEGTLCEDLVPLAMAYTAAGRVSVISDVVYIHRRRDGAITSDLIRPRIVADWIMQSDQARAIIAQRAPGVIATYLARFLDSELWSRVQYLGRLDPDAYRALSAFVGRLLRDAPAGVVEGLTSRKRLLYRAVAEDLLDTATRPAQLIRTPDSNLDEVARSISALDPAGPVGELRETLAESEIVKPELLRRPTPIDAMPELMRAIELLWPTDTGQIPSAITAGTRERLAAAVAASDAALFAELWNGELLHPEAWIDSVRQTPGHIVVRGGFRARGDLGPSTVDLVLRSEEGWVRRVRVASWPAPEGMSWQASVPVGAAVPEGTWRARLRVERHPAAPREFDIDAGDGMSAVARADRPGATVAAGAKAMFTLSVATASAVESDDVGSSLERTGRRVVVYPYWTDNPFLTMLYLDARGSGLGIDGVTGFSDAMTRLADCGPGDVFHLHWTSAITQILDNEPESRRRLATFRREVGRARSRGARLIWTVHNHGAHDLYFPALEAELIEFLAREVDVIHVMNPGTVGEIPALSSVDPARIVTIPHPTYVGVYGARLNSEDARSALGVAPGELAVLHVGQIRAYKGVTSLLAAVERAAGSRPLALLLAGQADPRFGAVVEAGLPGNARVVAEMRFLPDDDIPLWMSAADLAVFPYRRILNSGSAQLALSFGLPVVLPDTPSTRAQYGSDPAIVFFDPHDPVTAIAGLLEGWDRAGWASRRDALEARAALTRPIVISRRITELLLGS